MNSCKLPPHNRGCRWPAEWEPHEATWIAWPHNRSTWPGNFAPVPQLFAHIIRTLAQYEPVRVLAGGNNVYDQAGEMVGDQANVTLYDIPTNDVWVRDYGPTFIDCPSQQDVAAIDWQFNSWGGKYPPWNLDNAVVQHIAQHLGIRRFAIDTVLEGGSIDGNGCGTVLTTKSCLLDTRRNSGMNAQRIEHLLQQSLCANEVIWIEGGPVAGDDTDGHVDQLARFVSERQITVAVEHDPQDENYGPLQHNLRMLEDYRKGRATPLEIIPLPQPKPIYVGEQRVPASYCNFYIANGCVLVPVFDDARDSDALQILQSLFPDRAIVSIPAGDLIWGLGALHCITQQQPRISNHELKILK